MSTRFKILVLRLLIRIYSHQLSTLRVCSEERKQIIADTENFIDDLVQKEKE